MTIIYFLLMMHMAEVCSQRDRYYYYNPYYQYYRSLPQSSAPHRSRAPSEVQKDQPKPRFDGPQVCSIREVFGTGERFYQEFVKELPLRVCDRLSFERRRCCPGFSRTPGTNGCSNNKPLTDIIGTAKSLGLRTFLRLLTNTQLKEDLQKGGAFTAFIPTEIAFKKVAYVDRQRLYPWTYNAPSLLHYHVIPGRLNYSQMTEGTEIQTLYYGRKPFRINTYSFGINTVNCAKITVPNQIASNGIVHVIDRVIKPLDTTGDLASFILRDHRFTQFARIIYAANMMEFLRDDKKTQFTVFVPSNEAMKKIPSNLRMDIFKNTKIAKSIFKQHIVNGVHCSLATLQKQEMTSLEGESLLFNCKYNGKYIQHAHITKEDLMTSNGVVHIINQVLLPSKVTSTTRILTKMKLSTFSELVHIAKLSHDLNSSDDITLFVPSDEAFKALPEKYLNELRTQPGLVHKLMSYHTVAGKIKSDSFIGGQTLQTAMKGYNILINVFRKGIVINDASLVAADAECSKAIIHIIDRVLVPPEHALFEILGLHNEYSVFRNAIERAGVKDIFTNLTEKYTVFVPTNRAMDKVDRKLYRYVALLKSFVLRHVTNNIIVTAALIPGTSYTVPALNSEKLTCSLDADEKTVWLNKNSKIIDRDRIATNGYLHGIDRKLFCRCKV